MAAHFKDLRISCNQESESSMPSTSSGRKQQVEMDVEAGNATKAEQMSGIHPRLVLSEELKRLQQEPILPSSFLNKL